MNVEYAKGWNPARVEAQARFVSKPGMVVGFKAPSTYVSKERLDHAFTRGTPIRRVHREGPPFPCSSSAVHAAVHPGHGFVRRGVLEFGVVYLVSMNAHGLDGPMRSEEAKWFGNQYRVVARIDETTTEHWSRSAFLDKLTQAAALRAHMREVEK